MCLRQGKRALAGSFAMQYWLLMSVHKRRACSKTAIHAFSPCLSPFLGLESRKQVLGIILNITVLVALHSRNNKTWRDKGSSSRPQGDYSWRWGCSLEQKRSFLRTTLSLPAIRASLLHLPGPELRQRWWRPCPRAGLLNVTHFLLLGSIFLHLSLQFIIIPQIDLGATGLLHFYLFPYSHCVYVHHVRACIHGGQKSSDLLELEL